MSDRDQRNASQPGMPGLSMMSDLISAYASAWGRHIQALNDAWAGATSADAAVSEWPKAWSRLAQAWSAGAQDICGVYMGHMGGSACAGSPFVTFVIDRSAETDAQPQTVPLPPGVDPTKLVATAPVSLAQDGHPTLAAQLILLWPVDDRIEIRLRVPDPAPQPGPYLSVIYESKAGDPAKPITVPSNPPPRQVIATVLIVFLDSPI